MLRNAETHSSPRSSSITSVWRRCLWQAADGIQGESGGKAPPHDHPRPPRSRLRAGLGIRIAARHGGAQNGNEMPGVDRGRSWGASLWTDGPKYGLRNLPNEVGMFMKTKRFYFWNSVKARMFMKTRMLAPESQNVYDNPPTYGCVGGRSLLYSAAKSTGRVQRLTPGR